MEKKEINQAQDANCWEYWNCLSEIRHKCYAYIYKSGRECWMFTKDFCPKREDQIYAHCWECPWYKKINFGCDVEKNN